MLVIKHYLGQNHFVFPVLLVGANLDCVHIGTPDYLIRCTRTLFDDLIERRDRPFQFCAHVFLETLILSNFQIQS